MSHKVLVTGTSVRPELLQPLIDAGYKVENPPGILSESDLTKALEDTSAYLFGGDELATAKSFSQSSKLKLIAFLGVGYESFIDVQAATKCGVIITNTPGTLDTSVAEFTIAHILNATRRLVFYADSFSSGLAGKEEKQHDLAGMRVGIVGLGAIGSRIAEVLVKGFGTQVAYYSRTRKSAIESGLGITYMTLADLTESVDVLIIMTPGNKETTSMIDEACIRTAKPGMVLINTARESIVASNALLMGLKEGIIAYAGFDGFYSEEDVNTQALKEYIPSRLTVTGHIASLTHEARDGMAKKAVQSILNVLSKGTDEYIVNR